AHRHAASTSGLSGAYFFGPIPSLWPFSDVSAEYGEHGMSTLHAESPRMFEARRINHTLFLADFRKLYEANVLPLAKAVLKADRGQPGRLAAPVIFTMQQRKNLFRTAFALALSPVTRKREIGPMIAAAGEIAWSCALIVDDIIDGSSEREGHPCAHLEFGMGR